MSFIKNAKIKTKILSVIIPVCVLGIGGAIILSTNYKNADSKYSDFIVKDNGALIKIARSSQRMAVTAYNTYQIVNYPAGSAEFETAMSAYRNNSAELITRIEEAKALLPEKSADFDRFLTQARSIVDATDKAVELGRINDTQRAYVQLSAADKLVTAAALDLRSWIETNARAVEEMSNALTEQTNKTITTLLALLGTAFALAIAVALLMASRGITGPIESLRARMASLADGHTEAGIDGIERKDEVGQMAAAVSIFRDNAIARIRLEAESEANRSMSERERAENEARKAREAADTKHAVDALATALERLASGDVAYRIPFPFVPELDGLRVNFNDSLAKLQDALLDVSQNARAIDAGANEIRSAADDLSRRTEQQAASVEETAAALEEITTTVKDSTRRAEEAGQLVARAREGAEKSGNVVRNAVSAMQQIEKSSSEISNIIGVIDEIAFQTNLLALNAGVEAARAGEAGKGFAVVAQEVRELAQRSAQAAKEIKALIVSSGEQVQTGVRLVAETGSSLETIVTEVKEINRHVSAIVEAAREQSTGLQEINTAVNTMDQGTQQNAAMVEQSTAASHSLAKEVTSLNGLLARFNLGGSMAARSTPQAASSRSQPVPSPARAAGSRLANAFNGNAAMKDWEDF